MAHLPEVSYGSDYRYARQGQFGGLKHCRSCSDGEIYDMNNITLDEFPLIKTRKPRKRFASINQEFVVDFYADNGQVLYTNTNGDLFIHGIGKMAKNLQNGRKKFVRFGNRVVVLPDKILLNMTYKILGILDFVSELPETGNTFGDAYAVSNFQTEWSHRNIYVWNGNEWIFMRQFDQPMSISDQRNQPLIGTYVSGNYGTLNSVLMGNSAGVYLNRGWKVGDAVKISGCTKVEKNNKTVIIRDIVDVEAGALFVFSDYAFETPDSSENAYNEEGIITLERVVPDMDFMFECNNRLWGAKGKTIYASKLGDPTNWYFFDGLSIDSWSIDTQSKGNIVGGWGDYYPYFLREDGMTIVCGSVPSGYQCYDKSAVPGLKKGEERSIAHAGGYTLWLSREGMVLFGDDTGRIMKDTFRDWDLNDMKAISAGTKAYFLCWTEKEHNYEMNHVIFCFDSRTGLWEKQDGARYTELAYDGGVLYGMSPAEERSDINILNGGTKLRKMMRQKYTAMCSSGIFTATRKTEKLRIF